LKKGKYLVFTISLFVVLIALFFVWVVPANVRHGYGAVESSRHIYGILFVTFYDREGEYLANTCEDGLASLFGGVFASAKYSEFGVTPGIEYSESFGVIIRCKVDIWGME